MLLALPDFTIEIIFSLESFSGDFDHGVSELGMIPPLLCFRRVLLPRFFRKKLFYHEEARA
jgi:hypothetical protein